MYRFAVLFPLLFGCIPNETLILPSTVSQCSGEAPPSLRVASYNIKSGSMTSLEQIGDVIADLDPDVLALQEVNFDPRGEDQPGKLAARLGYPYVFAAALSRGGTHLYGNVLISKLPFTRIERIDMKADWAAEPRVAIDATVCAGEQELRVIATHADVFSPGPNIATVCSRLDEKVTAPTVVLGDLNVQPHALTAFAPRGLVDVLAEQCEGPTFWSSGKRLDYVLVDESLRSRLTSASIGTSKASDHYPVWADFKWASP
jgi:endonuclease/exonuclease/phosphatase family metal-dependent hydrolase